VINRAVVSILALMLVASASSGFEFSFLNDGGWRQSPSRGWVDLLPSLHWSTPSWNFGSVGVGSSATKTFTISNTGNDIAEDVATTVTGAGFRIYSSATFGNISSGKTRTVKVEFKPTGAGLVSGFVNYTAPNIARVGVALSGTGVAAANAYKTSLAEYWDFTTATPLTGVHSSLVATNSGAVFKSDGDATTNGGTFTNDGVYKTTSITGETGAMSVLVRFKKGAGSDTGRLAVYKRNNTGFMLAATTAEIMAVPGNGTAIDNTNWGTAGNTAYGRRIVTADTSWHTVCVTFGAGTNKTLVNAYLDGVAQSTAATLAVSSGDLASDLFIIGAKWTGGAAGEPALDNSMISHTAVWNRELTADECAAVTTGTGYLYGGW
jgi:hypothetical protein